MASQAAVDGRCGLARISYPDGEILDQVSLEVVPLSSPCWLEGTSARVVFGAADGKLYRLAFESAIPKTGETRAEPVPDLIHWKDAPPSRGNVLYH